ncbi:hypothetical protein Dfri01_67010 [Dyadobacter frigoris]|nr:hypothetical protein Dfri01_67010 [Dyadobacter frigoris]
MIECSELQSPNEHERHFVRLKDKPPRNIVAGDPVSEAFDTHDIAKLIFHTLIAIGIVFEPYIGMDVTVQSFPHSAF